MIRHAQLRAAAGLAALSLGIAALLAGYAMAQPVYKDRERFDESGRAIGGSRHPGGREVVQRPATRTTPGPGYVGSNWGLGKPSYWGIGPRPDWGYSGD